MTLRRYRTIFIILFFTVKVILLIMTLLLEWVDAYQPDKMADIRGILFPTLAASFIVALNYLRNSSKIASDNKIVTKAELVLVIGALILYLLIIIGQLLNLSAEDEAFKQMKSNVVWVESIFGAVFGWIISDIKIISKKGSVNED